MDEKTAIAQLKKGDINGLETLVRLHYVHAVRTAYLITRDRPLAEDVVKAAFIKGYERFEQFDPARPFIHWFLKIVVNDAIKAATRQGGSREIPLDAEISPEITALEDDQARAEDWFEKMELRQEIWQALEKLSPLQRAVFVLRFYLDLSEAETAERLNCAVGTVKAHLHAARKRLRTLLSDLRTQ
jgi:RNA polymerase sigma-70 factor (ECF subfamily)